MLTLLMKNMEKLVNVDYEPVSRFHRLLDRDTTAAC